FPFSTLRMVSASGKKARWLGSPIGNFKPLSIHCCVTVYFSEFLSLDFSFFRLLLLHFFRRKFLSCFFLHNEILDFGKVNFSCLVLSAPSRRLILAPGRAFFR